MEKRRKKKRKRKNRRKRKGKESADVGVSGDGARDENKQNTNEGSKGEKRRRKGWSLGKMVKLMDVSDPSGYAKLLASEDTQPKTEDEVVGGRWEWRMSTNGLYEKRQEDDPINCES